MPPFRMMDMAALSLVAVSLVAVGCAKRPATTVAAAPAPTGEAATQPGAARTPAPARTPAAPGTVTPGDSAARPAPAPATRPSPRDFVAVPDLKDVHFDFDRYDIRPADARVLDQNARWLNANPDHLVLVEGHADERGTNAYNLALGERRAKATMNYLVSRGVQAGRFTTISYGEERPACPEKTEACWSRNRRAHFLVKPQ